MDQAVKMLEILLARGARVVCLSIICSSGILLVPFLFVSWFGYELGAPQRLEGAEWGFAQERNIMYELLHGCVLLTITNSVWTRSVFLKNAQSLVHDSAAGVGTLDKSHLASLTGLQLIFFSDIWN